MKPPYTITPDILRSVTSVSAKIGEINARYLTRQSPTLRKQNQMDILNVLRHPFSIKGANNSHYIMAHFID